MGHSRLGVIGERGHDDVSGFWIGVFHNAGKLLALAGIVKRKFGLFISFVRKRAELLRVGTGVAPLAVKISGFDFLPSEATDSQSEPDTAIGGFDDANGIAERLGDFRCFVAPKDQRGNIAFQFGERVVE
jgi:hypothetical protein